MKQIMLKIDLRHIYYCKFITIRLKIWCMTTLWGDEETINFVICCCNLHYNMDLSYLNQPKIYWIRPRWLFSTYSMKGLSSSFNLWNTSTITYPFFVHFKTTSLGQLDWEEGWVNDGAEKFPSSFSPLFPHWNRPLQCVRFSLQWDGKMDHLRDLPEWEGCCEFPHLDWFLPLNQTRITRNRENKVLESGGYWLRDVKLHPHISTLINPVRWTAMKVERQSFWWFVMWYFLSLRNSKMTISQWMQNFTHTLSTRSPKHPAHLLAKPLGCPDLMLDWILFQRMLRASSLRNVLTHT